MNYGIGEILATQIASIREKENVTPLTQCAQGFKVVYVISTHKYSCVSETTAEKWFDNNIAEEPNVSDYLLSSIELKSINREILGINLEIRQLNDGLEIEQLKLKAKFDRIYDNIQIASRTAEKHVVSNFNSNNAMTQKDLSDQLIEIRKALKTSKEDIVDQKENAIKELQKEYEENIVDIRIKSVDIRGVEIVWNSDRSSFEAVEQ